MACTAALIRCSWGQPLVSNVASSTSLPSVTLPDSNFPEMIYPYCCETPSSIKITSPKLDLKAKQAFFSVTQTTLLKEPEPNHH